MFDFIKNIFRGKVINKTGNDIQTGLTPVSNLRSVTVLLDINDAREEGCLDRIRKYFKTRGMSCEIWFLDLNKKHKEGEESPDPERTITKKDLNWFDKPSRERINKISGENPELFISLVNKNSFTIAFITKSLPAKFKIGRMQLKTRIFDLVIEDSPSGEFTASQAFDEIVKYLTIIK